MANAVPDSTRTRPTFTSSSPPPPATTTTGVVVPPEVEQTLSTLTSHRSVLGYLLIARGGAHPSIIRSSGVVFEGEKGSKYAGVVARIVESVQSGLEEVDESIGEETSDKDEVRFMRIRTKRHEILLSPDERYLLAVLHDPSVS